MNTIKELARTIIVVMILVAGVSLVSAWTAPTQAPPGGNVSAPVNVGALSQVKSGPLQVNGFRNIGNSIFDGNATFNNSITLGGVPRTTWPEGGGGGGGISGSGTANYLAKWTAGTTLGNSIIYDNGANVGIGTAAPTQKLDVGGNINVGGSQVRMSNSSSHFYGDASNLASRSATGDFYIQNSTGGNGRLITPTICLSGDCRTAWPSGGGSWPAGSYCIMANGACPAGFVYSDLNLLVGLDAHDHCEGQPQFAGTSECKQAWTPGVSRQILKFCCK